MDRQIDSDRYETKTDKQTKGQIFRGRQVGKQTERHANPVSDPAIDTRMDGSSDEWVA